MDANIFLILLFILLFCVIIFSFPTKCMMKEGFQEGFYIRNYCPSCAYLGRERCNNCTNCGYCISNGFGECVPGNSNGPFYRTDCDFYSYGNSNLFFPVHPIPKISYYKFY